MDAATEIGRDPVSKHRIQPEYMENEKADTGTGRSNLSRKTKSSDANGDRKTSIFPVQQTTSRIGNLTPLIHTLLFICDDYTYSLGMWQNDLYTVGHSVLIRRQTVVDHA